MSVINVLPVSLRNKIAAGEVVERPASVVKELIENAIDASSTRISVETVRAGKKLIHVSDNGTGMDRDDAVSAFERYATSKIRDEQDLFNLKTMGFRGEALSSIASVSKMTLKTALRNAEQNSVVTGTCVEIAGGEITSVKDCAASGTSLEVRELFFNTPARRKFLKSDATENYHIIDAVTREALSHHKIMFVLRMDGSEVFSLPAASSIKERLVQLYGKDFIDGLIEFAAEDAGLSVSIFTSGLEHMKNNRNAQFLFVNRRPVKDQSIAYAVSKAYEGMVPKEKHPAFFVFLDLDAGQVDFNVHPAKREVRFAQKNGVFDFVYNAVREGLKKDSGFCSVRTEAETTGTGPLSYPVPSAGDLISEEPGAFFTGAAPVLYLGETFVAVTNKDGLVLLDYHAAHERVNYERFLKKTDLHSHRLLFPHQVKLPRGEYAVLVEHLPLLNEVGLEAEDFGHDTIIVRSIPGVLIDADIAVLMGDIASALLENPGMKTAKGLEPVDSERRIVAARMACHSSIRGKEIPDAVKVAELLKSLDTAENPHSCPHGRPTRIFISFDELRKMFKK
ncbi:MAG: DNA mismatch repair endonuclease MutL [Nitrospirae bacterium]|nr:DNA mismatch repair endonuclease MutL [Nitrospirota bacterium]